LYRSLFETKRLSAGSFFALDTMRLEEKISSFCRRNLLILGKVSGNIGLNMKFFTTQQNMRSFSLVAVLY